ncbi:MAG: serine--tRNA ligase [Beijerinckiaceae bacterium]
MHDIAWIRDNAAAFDAAMDSRGLEVRAASLLALDDARRAAIAGAQNAQTRRNALSKEIGAAKAAKDEARAQGLMAQVNAIKESLPKLEEQEKAAQAELTRALDNLPNTPFPASDNGPPIGKDEHDNVVYRTHGAKPGLKFAPKEHYELGDALGGMDFETAAKISGSRFVVMKSGIARLHRALGQFMLDTHTAPESEGGHGYMECNPPLLVKDHAAYGTANLPKFAEDLFWTLDLGEFSTVLGEKMAEQSGFLEKMEESIRESAEHFPMEKSVKSKIESVLKEQARKIASYWLIPTAEVSLTNFVRDSILDEKELPLRLTALTPCFRSEAGSAGRDTRGMLRQHQFEKCELVSITTPETSRDEHERMLWAAENILKKLGLHYRVMTLCTGDMGFASKKTYDIEVWLPGQNAYREISSCSVCGDFQARRMNARVKNADGKGTRFVHTLNGSGIAVGRALIAVMENYQNADGSITIPDVLLPYMGGRKTIEKAV